MTPYKPIFYSTPRDKKLAVWVRMPDGKRWNVGDFPVSLVPKIQAALRNAFELGVIAYEQLLEGVKIPSTEWRDGEGE